jgi:hypothetical protein
MINAKVICYGSVLAEEGFAGDEDNVFRLG